MDGKPVFHPVVTSEKLIEDQGQPFLVEGVRVMLIRHDGKLYALDDLCPHADASMAFGMVGNGCIACPWHYAEFELATGKVLSGPAVSGLKTHQVREKRGVIEVALSTQDETSSSGSEEPEK